MVIGVVGPGKGGVQVPVVVGQGPSKLGAFYLLLRLVEVAKNKGLRLNRIQRRPVDMAVNRQPFGQGLGGGARIAASAASAGHQQ